MPSRSAFLYKKPKPLRSDPLRSYFERKTERYSKIFLLVNCKTPHLILLLSATRAPILRPRMWFFAWPAHSDLVCAGAVNLAKPSVLFRPASQKEFRPAMLPELKLCGHSALSRGRVRFLSRPFVFVRVPTGTRLDDRLRRYNVEAMDAFSLRNCLDCSSSGNARGSST